MSRPLLALAASLALSPLPAMAQAVCGLPHATVQQVGRAVLHSTARVGEPQDAASTNVGAAARQGTAADTVTACGPTDPLPNLAAVSSMVASALNFDFGVDPYSLVSTSVKFSEDATKQKLSISPLKLRTDPTAWNDLSLALTTSTATTTFTVGATYDQAAHYAGRRRRVIQDFNVSPELRAFRATPPVRMENESLADYQRRIEAEEARVYSRYWMERFRNTSAFTLATSVQTFGSTVASRVDLDNDGKIDNANVLRGYGGSLQFLHRWSFWTASTLTVNAAKRRTSAIQGTPIRNNYGASLSLSRVFFLLDPSYLTSKDYRSRLYVPSLAGGASAEWQKCEGKALECDDRLISRWSFMPYLDTKLPGGAQFRIGIPLRRDHVGDKTGARIEPMLQFGWSQASF